MGDDIASISLTRSTWTAIFISQVWYIYTLVLDRLEETPGSERWLQLDASIKEALKTFMPVLSQAADTSPEMGKLWFDLKRDAGFFPGGGREDKLKEVVQFL